MKKIGLLSIIGCSVSGVAIAAGVDCNTIPTCAELGFIKTTTECEGKKTLRCPFDVANDSAVYCGDAPVCSDEYNLDACPENGSCEECGGKQKFNGCNSGYSLADGNVCCSDSYYNLTSKPANSETEQCGNKYHFVSCNDGYIEENGSCVFPSKTCVVGDVLYNDLKCYTTAPSGKTAIGVVFDTANRLALGNTISTNKLYWSGSNVDVSAISNCSSTTSCGVDGKANTLAVVNAGGSNASTSYAPGYCYYLTDGRLSEGEWFLPSARDLTNVFNNLDALNLTFTSIGVSTISSGYWSSTEYNSSNGWAAWYGSKKVGVNIKQDYYYVRCAVAY